MMASAPTRSYDSVSAADGGARPLGASDVHQG